jgi:chorismate mutase
MSVRKLKNLRGQIDRIDRRLLDLLNERSKVALHVGKIKKAARKEVYAPLREKELLDALPAGTEGLFRTMPSAPCFGKSCRPRGPCNRR